MEGVCRCCLEIKLLITISLMLWFWFVLLLTLTPGHSKFTDQNNGERGMRPLKNSFLGVKLPWMNCTCVKSAKDLACLCLHVHILFWYSIILQYLMSSVVIPYSGKLLREKPFMNFTVLCLLRSFLRENLGRGVLWHGKSEQSVKVFCTKSYFH